MLSHIIVDWGRFRYFRIFENITMPLQATTGIGNLDLDHRFCENERLALASAKLYDRVGSLSKSRKPRSEWFVKQSR